MKFRTISAILFFLLLAALLILSYWPNIPDIKVRMRGEWFRLDYIGHFGFYASTAFSFLLWQAGWREKIPAKLLLLTLLGGFILAVLNEYIQRLIPGRSYNLIDMMYSCIGVILGVAGIWVISVKWKGDKVER